MSMDGQNTKCCRNIAENFNRLSRAHERYRRQTDGLAIAYDNSEREREFTFFHVRKESVYICRRYDQKSSECLVLRDTVYPVRINGLRSVKSK